MLSTQEISRETQETRSLQQGGHINVGAAFARIFGEEPSQQMEEDLHRLKQWMEAGEIATTYGQPVGQR